MTKNIVKLNELTSKDIEALMKNSKVMEKVNLELSDQVNMQLYDFIDKLQGLGNYSISDSSDYENCLPIENAYLFLTSLKDACECNVGVLSDKQIAQAGKVADLYSDANVDSEEAEEKIDSLAEEYANILLDSMVADYDVIYNDEKVKDFMIEELEDLYPDHAYYSREDNSIYYLTKDQGAFKMTKQTVKIFNNLKNNEAITVDLSNEVFHIDDNQAYTLKLADNIDCGVYRAYANVYGQPRILLDFTSFPAAKLVDLKKKLNKIGAVKVTKNAYMFYLVSYNDHGTLNDVYTQAREALDLYEYAATAYGIGIVKIDYGIDDKVIFRDMHNDKKLHRVKINYSGDTTYFNYRGRRFNLNDFIRTNL